MPYSKKFERLTGRLTYVTMLPGNVCIINIIKMSASFSVYCLIYCQKHNLDKQFLTRCDTIEHTYPKENPIQKGGDVFRKM